MVQIFADRVGYRENKNLRTSGGLYNWAWPDLRAKNRRSGVKPEEDGRC